MTHHIHNILLSSQMVQLNDLRENKFLGICFVPCIMNELSNSDQCNKMCLVIFTESEYHRMLNSGANLYGTLSRLYFHFHLISYWHQK